MLIYGATGKAGRLVMERALERGWAVVAFVRNPDKVPEAQLRYDVTSAVESGSAGDVPALVSATSHNRRACPFRRKRGREGFT
jgi:uncharacterized protein YbjT (DUF2867 family)